MAFTDKPRRAVVAGQFYPGDAPQLRGTVQRFLDAAAKFPAECAARIAHKGALAAMVPHAGYVFSGALAGITLAQAALSDTIIILAPNHTGLGERFAVWNGGPWQTPLGSIPVDQQLSQALVDSGAGFLPDDQAHLRDHSIEVVVPFLQVLRPDASIVALSIGGGRPDSLRAAGRALAVLLQERGAAGRPVSLVVSSDMNHFKPHAETVSLDAMALEKIRALDPEGLFATVRAHGISMCGVLPMTMALCACRELGADSACITGYATSGQTGKAYGAGMDKVVGYAGALVPA